MLNHISYQELGHANHGWLDARHHFSFAAYHNPSRMNFGALRVINDDVIKAGAGFDLHPHKDMEIITYVRQGAITHRDSQGNVGRTGAGDVQVMSAGTGVFHSEFNLESEDTNLYQIWIEPNKLNVAPRWDSHEFPAESTENQLSLLVSGNSEAPLQIHQDAFIYAGNLRPGVTIEHEIKHQAYILASEGAVDIEGVTLRKGDALEVTEQSQITIKALEECKILLIDVPNNFSQ